MNKTSTAASPVKNMRVKHELAVEGFSQRASIQQSNVRDQKLFLSGSQLFDCFTADIIRERKKFTR